MDLHAVPGTTSHLTLPRFLPDTVPGLPSCTLHTSILVTSRLLHSSGISPLVAPFLGAVQNNGGKYPAIFDSNILAISAAYFYTLFLFSSPLHNRW